MKILRLLLIITITLITTTVVGTTQQLQPCSDQGMWTSINFQPGYLNAPLLLTDGRVMAQYVGGGSGNAFQDWYALTPDPIHGGCYNNANGCTAAWTQLPSLTTVWSDAYAPYAFASAVLADGNVIVQGGEFNFNSNQWTNMGAIYNPVQISWSQLTPPGGFNEIGDAQSVVLASDTYMVAGCGTGEHCNQYVNMEQAQYDEATQVWTVIQNPGNNKADSNGEEGYTLLPGGNVLTVDIANSGSEIFNPNATPPWSSAGTVPVALVGGYPTTGEVGPAMLLANLTVFATGALPFNLSQMVANSAIYNPSSGWSPGPSFPVINGWATGMGDEMSVLLPDGNVLLTAHDNADTLQNPGTYYVLEYQPSPVNAFCQVTNAPQGLTTNNGAGTLAASVKMLLLPNGQVLATTHRSDYYIYAPTYTTYYAYAPTISIYPHTVIAGSSYGISGTQFNGVSQANQYGDDFQNATNYPLVQITDSHNHVFYARTHGHSSMGVATGSGMITSTNFDVPNVGSGIASGQATLVVIANGIPSSSVNVCIAPCTQ